MAAQQRDAATGEHGRRGGAAELGGGCRRCSLWRGSGGCWTKASPGLSSGGRRGASDVRARRKMHHGRRSRVAAAMALWRTTATTSWMAELQWSGSSGVGRRKVAVLLRAHGHDRREQRHRNAHARASGGGARALGDGGAGLSGSAGEGPL
uniref:Uncharacterized protein n=1 Tax=Arundo donax TaxID=35708 RepID=A0A0A9EY44_ARUDO